MPDQKFNQPYYKIHFADLDDDLMGVVSFEGEEEISGLFEFRIILASLDPKIDSTKILNKTATFTLTRPDESTRQIYGYISSFEQTGKSRDYIFYKVVLVPRIWQLNLIFQSAVYQNIKMKDLIQKILEDCKLGSGDFKYDTKNDYPESEFWVQYRETNLNFLNRRLEHFGIYYFFDHGDDKDVICFTDDNSKLLKIDSSEKLGFNENHEPLGTKESIFEFLCREKVVTGAVQLKDYNYMYPEKELVSEIAFDSEYPGNFYDYGDHFENEKEADFLAEVRSEEIFCQSKIFYGTSDCRVLSAGYKFTLEKHYRDDWNAEYIITSITHKGNQHNLFQFQHASAKDKPYENNFTAIPADIDFRPIRRAKCPKIYGVMNAKVDDSSDGKYASIDEHGRYKVKIPFDLSDKKDGEASLFIRMAQPHAGANYGFHFPLHKNAEVLLVFIDGDPDRPIIASSVPNPSNASPVKSANQTKHIIKTSAENEIELDDVNGKELVHIHQACGNEIFMRAEGPEIEIKQKNGNDILLKEEGPDIEITQKCGNYIKMKTEEGIELKDKYNNQVNLNSKEGTVTLSSPSQNSKIVLGEKENAVVVQTDGSKEEKIGQKHHLEWEGANLSIKGSAGVSGEIFAGVKHETFFGLKTAVGMSKVIEKNLSERIFKTQKHFAEITSSHEEEVGSYKLDATTDIELESGTKIELKCGGSSITLKYDGTIEVKCKRFDVVPDMDFQVHCGSSKFKIATGYIMGDSSSVKMG